jgi:molybdopterin-guanine dinucleotide biosynthesis protein A
MMVFADVTVAVLAGGKSSRMGRDKAQVQLGAATLGEHALALAHTLSDDIIVLGHGRGMPFDAQANANVRHVDDAADETGPLGGIAALRMMHVRARILVLPVDMPLLARDNVAPLLAALSQSVACAYLEHPLPLAVRDSALAALPVSGSLGAALTMIGATRLPAPAAEPMENINDHKDLVRAMQRRRFS